MAQKILASTEINDENNDNENNIKKYSLKIGEVSNFLKNSDEELLLSLLGPKSQNIFQRFKIVNFSHMHPSKWLNSEEYQGKLVIGQLKVVNDSADRGIQLIQDYNEKVTTDESQKQFLLQSIKDYKSKYPLATKDVLKNQFNI